MDRRKKLGQQGEDLTARMLEKKGFVIEHRNYRKRYGEIDLIASKKELLVFVEVKRRTRAYFHLEQLITPRKQRKIIMVAKEYIARYNQTEKVCRFDVALIDGNQLTYLPNAFTEGEYYD